MDPDQLKGILAQAQSMAQSLQGDLAGKKAEGSAGGGLVRVEVNGANQVTAVHLDPRVVDPADPALLEDLVRAATNQAFERLRELVADEVRKRTGGMLPGLF